MRLVAFWMSLLSAVSTGLVVSPAFAQDRNTCPSGAVAPAHVVAADGVVRVTSRSGETRPLELGDVACPGDRISTGQASRVELQFAGADTTTGASSNTTLLIPEPEPGSANIEISGGLMRFISSVRGFFKVRTPFQDAGIEGTEAVLAVDGEVRDSLILVAEGLVTITDRREAASDLRLTDGQASYAGPTARAARATAENVPEKFRSLLLDPKGASDWAIYYPPVLLASGVDDAQVSRAAQLLEGGDPDGAEAMLIGRSFAPRAEAAAFALRAVIAVFRNNPAEGLALADAAVERGPELGAAHVARSYALQAAGRLEEARDAAADAVAAAPDDAFAWARLAELHLTIGERRAARKAVEESLAREETALARTIEGFAALSVYDHAAADQAFRRAIGIDSEAPLPHLGLGLSSIRLGRTEEGRREIETAVALDPRRASLRTWLGRAYFEEGLGKKAGSQFALAQEADPDDPNAYLFSAQQRFQANDPIGALRELETAQRVGERRSVVRSAKGLGEDRAVRSAAIGRVYDVLSFERLFQIVGGQAVDEDPTNPEAHRLLADAARTEPDGEITQVSEILKADLLAPPSNAPIQPQLGEINLALLESSGPARVTFAEYAPLFEINGFRADLSGFGGTQETLGYQASVTALHDNFSIGIGSFLSDTDGYDFNNDVRNDIFAAQAKYQLTNELTLFSEFGRRKTEGGDRRLDLAPGIMRHENLRVDLRNNQFRIGAHFQPESDISVISYAEFASLDTGLVQNDFPFTTRFDGDEEGFKIEGSILANADPFDLQFGFEYSDIDAKDNFGISLGPMPIVNIPSSISTDFLRAYGYVDVELPKRFFWTLGAAVEHYEENGGLFPVTRTKIQPKLGLTIQPNNKVTLRTAYAETLTRRQIFPETLERTTVASFNQFFDDAPGIEKRVIAGGIDTEPLTGLRLGVGAESFKTRYPDRGSGKFNGKNLTIYGYVSGTPHRFVAISLEPQFSFSKDNQIFQIDDLDTLLIPADVSYFHPSGLFASSGFSYFDQSGSDLGADFSKSGVIVDGTIGFRLPNGRALLALEVQNIFDVDVNYIQRDGVISPENFEQSLLNRPRFAPERSIIASMVVRF